MPQNQLPSTLPSHSPPSLPDPAREGPEAEVDLTGRLAWVGPAPLISKPLRFVEPPRKNLSAMQVGWLLMATRGGGGGGGGEGLLLREVEVERKQQAYREGRWGR